MHTTLRSAKAYAESNRVQGTVFNISDLPTLHVSSSVGSVFVTQINTNAPLMDYSRSAVSDHHWLYELMENHRNDYLVPGASINGVVLSFDFDSRFWRSPPPAVNSIIITTTLEKDFGTSVLQKSNKHRCSLSYGGSYALRWVEKDSEISSGGVLRLLEH
ncbi:hypothetical protein [Pseudomonas syringae]|uniref:hypothetical protein n=1 Tax=Pseudomonas syringae TaxID=317 RepID=UPI001F3176CC|nr:hypothetical protein [Pseudomonas syringae]MCF5704728.1 hypothetical protein [Pseudomonas syringae]